MTPRQRKIRDRNRRRRQKRQAGSWQTLEAPKKRRPHNAAKTARSQAEPKPKAQPTPRRQPVVIGRGSLFALLLMAASGAGDSR